jgi:ligand-binding sensor domain-containing protein
MGGLIRYNGTKFMVWDDENSFLPEDITTINKDNFGNLWIGTQNQGIILYNPKGIVYEENN